MNTVIEHEKQLLINKFFLMIRKLNKNRTALDLLEIKKFFSQVSETKQFIPPTVEFMTILKNYRPLLFHEFKVSLVSDTNMYRMSNINFDLGEAITNLGIYDEQQLRKAIKG